MKDIKADSNGSDHNWTKRPEKRSSSRSLRVAVALVLMLRLIPEHWSLDGLNQDSPQEEKLNESLDALYKDGSIDIDVECDRYPASKQELTEYNDESLLGFVNAGNDPHRIHLKYWVCDSITEFDPRSIVFSQESLESAFPYISGVETLIHEAEHARGEHNESNAEYNAICGGLALRHIELARGGSLDADLASVIQRILEELNKKARPEEYQVNC